MPKYDFPVPSNRGIPATNKCGTSTPGKCAKDIIMHMLLARVASEDGSTTELQTIFNPLINALDIDVPEDVLEAIESIGIGPNLQRFMSWMNETSQFDSIQLTPNLTENPAHSEGLLFYDNVNKSLAVYNSEADITLQVGQEQWILIINETGSTITNGRAVRVVGSDGDEYGVNGAPKVALAQADLEGTAFAVGLATHDIENNSVGFVTSFGTTHDVDTSAFSGGDRLWLSPTVPGGWTNVKPSQPNVVTEIGIVIKSDATEGSVFVDPNFADYYTKAQVDNIINNIEIGGVSIPNIITVAVTAGSGGELFISIEEAIDEINSFAGGPNEATATNPYTIRVTPGSYTENNPLQIPEFISVVGDAESSTIVNVSDNNENLFVLGTNTTLENLTIYGPTAKAGIYVDTVNNGIRFITFREGLYGIHATGSGNTFVEGCKFISAPAGEVTTSLYTDAGGTINASNCYSLTIGPGATNGSYANGGTILLNNSYVSGGTNGVYANNGGTIIANLVTIENATNSLRTGTTGLNNIRGSSTTSLTSDTWDLLQEATNGHIILSGANLLVTKLSLINPREAFIDFNNDFEGDEGYVFAKELNVGLPELGKETVLGEGDSYTRGMFVYTYNPSGTVWADVSVAAGSVSGSTFTFPAIAQDNAIYISSDINDTTTSDKKFFEGIKASIETAVVLDGGSIVVEYWNGAWVEFPHMSIKSGPPYTQYADAIFERAQSEQIRFDSNITSDWVKNDPPTIGDENRFWIRFRIATAVTTVPVFQQFKLHTNRTEINADGFVEYFGEARDEKTIEGINTGNIIPVVGKSPGNTAIDFGPIINLNATANTFANNASDGFGQAFPVPLGLDTSLPLRYVVRWAPATDVASGVVALDFTVGQAVVGTVLDGTNSETTFTDQTVTIANSADAIHQTIYEFYIKESLPEEGVFFVLQRQATGGTGPTGDTYDGNIYIVNTELVGQFWH